MDTYDKEEGYCRTLGHYVPFRYCRTVKDGAPCHRILDCWFERIPVKAYLQEHHTDEEIAGILEPPRPKMASLIDLIEKAKKR